MFSSINSGDGKNAQFCNEFIVSLAKKGTRRGQGTPDLTLPCTIAIPNSINTHAAMSKVCPCLTRHAAHFAVSMLARLTITNHITRSKKMLGTIKQLSTGLHKNLFQRLFSLKSLSMIDMLMDSNLLQWHVHKLNPLEKIHFILDFHT